MKGARAGSYLGRADDAIRTNGQTTETLSSHRAGSYLPFFFPFFSTVDMFVETVFWVFLFIYLCTAHNTVVAVAVLCDGCQNRLITDS